MVKNPQDLLDIAMELAVEAGLATATVHAYKYDATNPQILIDCIVPILVIPPQQVFTFNPEGTMRNCLIQIGSGKVQRSIWFHERYGC